MARHSTRKRRAGAPSSACRPSASSGSSMQRISSRSTSWSTAKQRHDARSPRRGPSPDFGSLQAFLGPAGRRSPLPEHAGRTAARRARDRDTDRDRCDRPVERQSQPADMWVRPHVTALPAYQGASSRQGKAGASAPSGDQPLSWACDSALTLTPRSIAPAFRLGYSESLSTRGSRDAGNSNRAVCHPSGADEAGAVLRRNSARQPDAGHRQHPL